jgi:hypothetical protein
MRPLSLKIASLLAAMFLFNFSCQDHVVPDPQPETPEEIRPIIVTLGLSVENESTNLYRFNLSIPNPGNAPISELGMVYSIEPKNGSQSFTNTPTIADSKSIFTDIELGGDNFQEVELDLKTAKKIYYRSYAIYGAGKLVYGEVLVFDPNQAIIEVPFKTELKKPYSTGVAISYFGKLPIKEFGIAYSYRVNANGKVNAFPNINDNKVVFTIGNPTTIGIGSIYLPISENSIFELYARSYIEYQDGTIQYGNAIIHSK